MRVRDLLSMSTGHHADAIESFPYVDSGEGPRARVPRAAGGAQAGHALRLQHAGHVHAVGDRAEGDRADAARLSRPAPVRAARHRRRRSGTRRPRASASAASGSALRTEDIARFGQLYLQRGQWNGRTAPAGRLGRRGDLAPGLERQQPDSDWDQGYGYQFWRCRHGAYRGDGAFGQYCIVMPEQDAVVAITSGLGDMQAVLNLVWEHLLPAMKPAAAAGGRRGARPAGAEARQPVARPAARAGRPLPWLARFPGSSTSCRRTRTAIEAIGIEAAATGTTLLLRGGGREHRIPCGQGAVEARRDLPVPAARQRRAGWR